VAADLSVPGDRRARVVYVSGPVSLCHTIRVRLVDRRGHVEVVLYGPRGVSCGRLIVDACYLTVCGMFDRVCRGQWRVVVRIPDGA